MKKFFRFLRDHIWGTSGSIVFHLIVLIILVRFVVLEGAQQDEAVVEIVMEVIPPPEELEEFDMELEELDEIPDVVEAVDIPVVSPETDPPVIDSLEFAASSAVGDFDIAESHAPVTFRNLYASRAGSGREDALGQHAGGFGSETEAAVMRALRWLKDHQYPDGSWGPQYRAAMTGLALLSFLAHGETTGSEEFGETVRRGLRYLVRLQSDAGWIVAGGPDRDRPGLVSGSQARVYEHVIATYALSEAYGLTAIPMLRPAMEDAVQLIIDGQLDNGGWAYGFVRDGPQHVDVSLGGWIIQTLKAASMADAGNRGLLMALENGVRGLRTMTDPRNTGLFGYSSRVPGHAPDHIMTGVAVLALQLSGYVGSEEAQAGMRALRPMNFNWQQDSTEGNHRRLVGNWPLYGWYYITQARFQHSRASWDPWNEKFAPGLSRIQNPDGSWGPPPGSVEGAYGPVYCTTFPALMLQVYYRLLPTFQPIPEALPDALLTDADDDDQISIRLED